MIYHLWDVIKAILKKTLSTFQDYGREGYDSFTESINWLQYSLSCCGIVSPADYQVKYLKTMKISNNFRKMFHMKASLINSTPHNRRSKDCIVKDVTLNIKLLQKAQLFCLPPTVCCKHTLYNLIWNFSSASLLHILWKGDTLYLQHNLLLRLKSF